MTPKPPPREVTVEPKEVRPEGRDQLLGYLINMRQSQEKTREWIETWLDAHCPIDPERVRQVLLDAYDKAVAEKAAESSARPAAEWVRCSERMPEKHERVQFVVTGEPGICVGPHFDSKWWDYLSGDAAGAHESYEDELVTHWAPLLPPPPPEGT